MVNVAVVYWSVAYPVTCATRGAELTENSVLVLCPPDCARGRVPVFGTGIYASISTVCGAAVHRWDTCGPSTLSGLLHSEVWLQVLTEGVEVWLELFWCGWVELYRHVDQHCWAASCRRDIIRSSVSPAVCWTSTKHQHHEGMCSSRGLILQPWTTSSSSAEARGPPTGKHRLHPSHLLCSRLLAFHTSHSEVWVWVLNRSEPEPSCSHRSRSVWSHNKVQLGHFGLDGLCSDPDQTSRDKFHSLVINIWST